ncbi:MAG: hypothetical protein LBT22_03270 [Peptococcaceae bacterium]|nr:hypothetical protein [Peptococcaceae bacterium]
MNSIVFVFGVSFFIMVIPLLAAVLILVVVLGARKTSADKLKGERGKNMIKTVYVYLVLFATLMMVIGGTVAAFMAVADIAAPTPYYQSFEDFKMITAKESSVAKDSSVSADTQTLSAEELQARYDEMMTEQAERSRKSAVNSLVKSLGWIVIPLPVFLYYQRRMKGQPAD